MGFAGAFDIVIASNQAQFSLSEVRIGVVPACISPYLQKKVPEGAIKELFITGMRFGPAKGLSSGLLNYVVEHDKLLFFADGIAQKLLPCGPAAIGICKDLFAKVPEMDLATANQYTVEVIARLRTSEEAQEGMKAFF